MTVFSEPRFITTLQFSYGMFSRACGKVKEQKMACRSMKNHQKRVHRSRYGTMKIVISERKETFSKHKNTMKKTSVIKPQLSSFLRP